MLPGRPPRSIGLEGDGQTPPGAHPEDRLMRRRAVQVARLVGGTPIAPGRAPSLLEGRCTAAAQQGQVRRAIAVLNRTFALLGLEKHPAKTFIGRVERGFDFLGYRVSPSGLTVAEETLRRFVARVTRLYEQEGDRRAAAVSLGLYVRRWMRWAPAGLPPLGAP